MGTNETAQACNVLTKKLAQISVEQAECSIYRVHRHLRDVNPKAYEPEVIAIGPYHRGKDDLKMMEDQKLRFLHLLLQRDNGNVEKYVSTIGALESKARKCYAEPINLKASDLIEMLVLDGCFIIELVRKWNMRYLRQKKDSIFHMDWIINSLQRDLMLFENQIPFFVLCGLFDLIEVPNQHGRLTYLLLRFFEVLYPGKVYRGRNEVESTGIKHLLDLINRSCRPPPLPIEGRMKRKRWQFISSATRLREANVKFERDIIDAAATVFNIEFNDGSIVMKALNIEDRTESVFRNLIAYEQYFEDTSSPIMNFMTDYVKLLDCLIDSSKDVEILCRNGIIENWLGDDEVVAKMVNKLADSVAAPGRHFVYAHIFEDVNKHCGKRRNRWMSKLGRNYLNSPWPIISILVALLLLLLTVTQTLFTILQVV